MTDSLESTIAEKFDAILQRFELTGLELTAVIDEIQKFLEPVFDAIVVNEDEWQKDWESNISSWSNLSGGIDHDKSS